VDHYFYDIEKEESLNFIEGTAKILLRKSREKMQEIYQRFEKEYEWLISDEQLLEAFKENEWEVKEDGTLWI